MKKFAFLFVIVIVLFAVAPVAAQTINPPADPAPVAFDWTYISQLLQALILATVPVLCGLAARWLNVAVANQKALLSDSQQYALGMFVKVAIYAAEQLKISDAIDSKLDYATELVTNWISARGLNLDVAEIRAQIEAAVRQEFPKPQFSAG